jgi:hypothetical protein
MRAFILLGGALLLIALPAAGGGQLAMRVAPAYAYEPATLTIQLSIEPDSSNRAVRVIAESAGFYRSSEIELHRDLAPRTCEFRYRSVPAGVCDVRGVLIGSDGRIRAVVNRSVTVIAAAGR